MQTTTVKTSLIFTDSETELLVEDGSEMWHWKINVTVVADTTMSDYYSVGMNLEAYVTNLFRQVSTIFR